MEAVRIPVRLEVRQEGAAVVVAFAEPVELQGDGSAVLRDRVRDLVADGHACIVVDVSRLTFADSYGLGHLVSSLRLARAAGGDLVLAGATGALERVLQTTRLDHVFTLAASVEDALGKIGDGS